MAVVNSTFTSLENFYGNHVVIYTWAAMGLTDTGLPVSGPGWADRSFQVEGTFGAGGRVEIEGSNDGVNYRTLNDPFGNSLSVSSAGVYELTQISLWMRPRISAGDVTTNITVTATLVRHTPS